jgi:hypothetical protein
MMVGRVDIGFGLSSGASGTGNGSVTAAEGGFAALFAAALNGRVGAVPADEGAATASFASDIPDGAESALAGDSSPELIGMFVPDAEPEQGAAPDAAAVGKDMVERILAAIAAIAGSAEPAAALA